MKYDIGYIYIIWDIEDPSLIYYGSTGDLYHRMAVHKSPSNTCVSKQIIERRNYEYAVLETHENIDEYDLHERESWYIRNKQCVNIAVPHRTLAEWREDNNEKIVEYSAEYYQKNKNKLQEKFVCECGGKFTAENKTHHEKTKRHLNYIFSLTNP